MGNKIDDNLKNMFKIIEDSSKVLTEIDKELKTSIYTNGLQDNELISELLNMKNNSSKEQDLGKVLKNIGRMESLIKEYTKNNKDK